MRLAEALGDAARQLEAVSDTPRLDAELLMAHAMGLARDAMLLGGDAPVPDGFAALLARRLAHEPVAYVTGTRDFWTVTLAVGPGVLIPRPDSETLVEAAIAHFSSPSRRRRPLRESGANRQTGQFEVGSSPGRSLDMWGMSNLELLREGDGPSTILDLGTGSGALLLAALDHWRGAQGLGIDRSDIAVRVAAANAARIAPGRAEIRQGDWAAGIDGTFDLVLCNPPYVEIGADLAPQIRNHEPAEALFAGADGLDAYRIVAPQIVGLIAPDGCACIEIGHDQAARAGALFAAQGLAVAVRRDLGGRDRCLVVTLG